MYDSCQMALRRPSLTKVLAYLGLAVVAGYAALLRFDAVTLQYGAVERPHWLRSLQETRASESWLRPSAMTWNPAAMWPHRDGPPTHYASDPYTYLQRAREMPSFYSAHRREPIFPYATKIALGLLHDQDVAVSFTSAFFSVLAILATCLLGTEAFSFGVGLAAAAALAIEMTAITWDTGGYRDSAFTTAVVLTAWGLLRYIRVPSMRHGVVLGVIAALACLIRITSISFLVPGLAYALIVTSGPWRARAKTAGAGVLLATMLVSPFLINCWRTFGDPLYSINAIADIYRVAGGDAQPVDTASEYLKTELRQPIRTIDTIAQGLTTYPFQNKWNGFNPWSPRLGRWLSWAAIVGLVLWIGTRTGRLLLLLLVASFVPYAVTWKLAAEWRLTEHAYPFFLLAACSAIAATIRTLRPATLRTVRARVTTRRAVFWAAALIAIAAGVWMIQRGLPILVVREALTTENAATIAAGERDDVFFTDGWNEPVTAGNVTARTSTGGVAVVRFPIVRVQDHDIRLRLDPFPAPETDPPSTIVRVFANDALVGAVGLTWDPGRVGAYQLRLPASVLHMGLNRLVLRTESRSGTAGIRFWLMRISPATPAGAMN